VPEVAISEAAAPEVAIMESTTAKFAAAAKFTATEFASHPAATESTEAATAESAEAAAAEAASHAAMEAAAAKAAAVEAATAEAATKAAAVATAHAATAAVTTAATATAATRQYHCWRSQANRRHRQQRDNCFTQHHHSPSETLAPNHNARCRWRSFWKTATGFDDCTTQLSESDAGQFKFKERVVCLNSKSEIKLYAASLKQSVADEA
jgi:hypothetical protein